MVKKWQFETQETAFKIRVTPDKKAASSLQNNLRMAVQRVAEGDLYHT